MMTRKYLRSTKEQKQRMYAKLLETLERNGDNPEQEDFELLQELI